MSDLAFALPPVLREGDRLNSEEFLYRWESMPELKFAELLSGVVFFMASPLGLGHARADIRMGAWLYAYYHSTRGCDVGSNATWVMGDHDVPQPDLFLRILPEHGGQSRQEGSFGGGAPELIVEITNSSISRDLGIKLDLYRRVGVREFITVLVPSQDVIWRELIDAQYQPIQPDADGLLRSRVFPGLWLDPEAVWDESKSVRQAVEAGVTTAEHAAFVQKLAEAKG